MSDPDLPLPAESPSPAQPVVASAPRCNWRRVRLYGWAILLSLSLWVCGAAYTLRHEPKAFIDHIFTRLPFAASTGKALWLGPSELELRYVRFGSFFYADRIVISATPYQLLHQHIGSLRIEGGDLFMDNLNAFLAQGKGRSSPSLDWVIDKVVLRRNVVVLDFGGGMPPVPVNIGERREIFLNKIRLGAPDNSAPMTAEQLVEVENIHFSSPLDPLAPVLSLPLVRIKFTYRELWHHQLRSVDLVQPQLYLGQDLFWFTDQFKQQRKNVAAAGPQSPWRVGRFGIEYGRLAINTFGQPRLHFPFFFDTQANDIRLDQLDKLSAKSVIAIRRFSHNYPEYKIHVVNLDGKLEFSVPPTDTKANNVVPTVHIDSIAWNDIPITDTFVSATFDPTGIYAKLTGHCEKGLLDGNLEVYYSKGFSWNADFFAHRVDCAPIAKKLAGKYATLTGIINGEIGIKGQGTTIQRCNGTCNLDQPGALTLTSVDDLVGRLPASLAGPRRDALKLLLTSVASYPYTTGVFQVDYRPGDGGASLHLNGPVGKRDFTVAWHPIASSEVAKDDGSK